MEKRIQEILEELYTVDSSLREHEEKLMAIIKNLLLSKPEVRIDAEFIGGLRRQLLASADELSGNKQSISPINLNFMKKLYFVLTGAAVVVVAVAGGLLLYSRGMLENLNPSENQIFSPQISIKALGRQAFGSLASANLTAATGMGGGGGAAAESAGNATKDSSASAAPLLGMGVGGGGGSPDGMIMPPYQPLKFVYKGEDFTVDQTEMPVYRRVKGLGTAGDVAQSLRNLNFGVLNLSSFNNLVLQSLNLVEDRDFGYSIFVNLQEGTISLSQNWLRWGDNGKLCGGGVACIAQAAPLQIGDVPDDAALIGLAGDFMAAHNIPVENYGEPFVQNFWRRQYGIVADKSQFYIPEAVSVVYPLKIEGQKVFDESGATAGLMVNIDVRYQKVSGIYELNNQQYESSVYQTETDVSRLIKLAEQGNFRGYYGGYYPASDAEILKDIELGTPKTGYMKLWSYQNNQSEELLVPALIFPITNSQLSPYYFQENVVIPLVKEILDNQGNNGGGVPVPMMEKR